ncbi:MAG: beta-propeller domain-containing protein [Polyangiales bacterium]
MIATTLNRRTAQQRWMVGCLLAAIGCSGPTEPGQTAPPSSAPMTDPMQIGQRDLPAADNVPIAEMEGARFPEQGSTSFQTATADEGSINGHRATTAPGTVARTIGPSTPVGVAPTATSAPLPTPAAPGAAPSAPASNPAAGPTTAAPGAGVPSVDAALREIVEADIVQAEGDFLYIVNRFRGLVIVDLSNPDSPLVRGRVPFQAQPVDMYLRDGNAYVVVSDYFSYWQFDSDADPLGFHGSRVIVVDVNDPTHPAEQGAFNVDGEVTDTRIVGDVLYAVSKRNPEYWRYDTQDWQDTTWVQSIALSDPTAIHQVQALELEGAAQLIQVYQTALSIAAIDPNFFLVDSDNVRQTKITYVDISDPAGAIKVGGSAYVPGSVQDKFKMDLHAGQLRVISNEWDFFPESAAVLTVFDAKDPSQLTQQAQIPLADDATIPNSHVRPLATRFSENDLFLNLCWYEQGASTPSCRIDFYDLSDPTQPGRVSQHAVDGAVTHFEVRGDRLISLGRGTGQNGISTHVNVSLFDVSNVRTPTQLSSVALGEEGASSIALSDYKAFKVLEEQQLILLPLTWREDPTNYITQTGAQLIDWQNDQLTVRGRVAQRSYVERAIAFRDRVLSISTNQLQVIDATNRDLPVATAELNLVRNVLEVFITGDYVVQLAQPEDGSNGFRYYVLPLGEDDMAPSIAELPVEGGVSYALRSGDLVYVFTRQGVPALGVLSSQTIRVADFSDPRAPRWRGSLALGGEIQHIYAGPYSNYASFYDQLWNPSAGQPLEERLLPVTARVVTSEQNGRRNYANALRLIDLRDPDNLRIAEGSVELPEFPFVNRVSHGQTLYSTHTEPALDDNGNPKRYHERYFLDRVDASDPEALRDLPKINIPGRLVDVDETGQLLYTVDYQWDEHGRRRNSFNVLRVENDVATLVSVLPVGDEIDRARYNDREIWLSTHSYPWYGRSDDSPDSRQPYTRLTRLRIDPQGVLAEEAHHDITGYHFDLLDVEAARVYLASSYPTGVLVLDTSDFTQPKTLGAARTVGYVSKLVSAEDALYMPMGRYGVRRVALQ